MNAEKQLCDELLMCWLEHGSGSVEFCSLLRHAAHEFDTETIMFTLLAIVTTLLGVIGEHIGMDVAVEITRNNFTKETAT